MYRRSLNIFVPTVSVFFLGSTATSVSADERNFGVDRFKSSVSKIVVTNEQELVEALKNENVTEVIVEGDVVISKRIDLTNSSRNVKITVGSPNALNSSLVVVQGTKINGGGKLTIVKSNDNVKPAISFKEVISTSGTSQTVFQNMTFFGNNNGIMINNTLDNLYIMNVNVENLTLFGNQKTNNEVLSNVNFINSSINTGDRSFNISHTGTIENITSVSLSFKTDPSIATGNIFVALVDDSGNSINSKNIVTDRRGNVEAFIDNLKQGTEYTVYFGISKGQENKVFFVSTPVRVSTLEFKSSVESETYNGAKIRISKNNLDSRYYPLYLVLKYEGTEFKKVQIPNHNTSGDIILNITGLIDDKTYEYEIVSFIDEVNPQIISKGSIKTLKNNFVSADGIVSGSIVNGSDNSDSKIFSFSVSDDDMIKSDVGDTYAEIYINPNMDQYMEYSRNFKTNFDGVDVEFINGRILINKLIPGKSYSGLKVYFETNDGKIFVLNLPRFTTHEETNNINKFVKDVYFNAFDRIPDEEGFWYWINKLSINEVNAEEFVKNLLNETEFISKRPTTESKIEGLYKVIVNRNSDSEGLNFWVRNYDALVSRGYSENFALKMTVNSMLSEGEFQNIVSDLV